MANINIIIKENVNKIGSSIYVAPDIPENKLNNISKAFKCEDIKNSILAIYDDTIFGSATEGLIFTGKRMIHHEYGEFLYSNIKRAYYSQQEDCITIKTKDGDEHQLKNGLSSIKKQQLSDFLNKIIFNSDGNNFSEENPLKPISEMSENLKMAYLQVIINMAYLDDNIIDEKELSEIFLLMTRLKLEKETRFNIRAYLTEITKDNMISLKELFEEIKKFSDESQHESIIISLVKDLANVYISSKLKMDNKLNISQNITNCLKNFKFIKDNPDYFNLPSEKIDIAIEAIKVDYENLRGNKDDSEITKNLKELAAKAAAAGTPLAAIYISGSVIGMSAAGITSGLAALGMGMGMTGGLAVVAIIGVLSYKGVQHLTGANELDKFKTKELMLIEVLKSTQKTITDIINDINFIVEKLNACQITMDEIESVNKNYKDLLIKKISDNKKLNKILSDYQQGLNIVNNKSDEYQNDIHRLHCPQTLDESRLESLKNEPNKKQIYDLIVNNYDNGKIKENIKNEELEEMNKAFQSIGYFNINNIIMNKTTETFSKIKGILG